MPGVVGEAPRGREGLDTDDIPGAPPEGSTYWDIGGIEGGTFLGARSGELLLALANEKFE